MVISRSVATHLLAIIAVTFPLAAVNATERPPRAGETPDAAKREPAAVGSTASTEPAPASATATTGATTAGAAKSTKKTVKPPLRRRSVQMTVDGMRPSAPPAVYAPTLTPSPAPSYTPSLSNSAALPSPGLPAPSTIRTPDRPVFINSCDAGGCISTDGARYNGGVGATLIGPQGRLCNRNGATVQC
jgi:hypothetical protein